MSASCGPLQVAFGNGNLVPSNESEYSYCSAGNDAILGSSLDSCKDCLSSTQDEKYLRNCLYLFSVIPSMSEANILF